MSNSRAGLDEADNLKVLHAFVLSSILYASPYLNLYCTDKDKTNALIRMATKAALNLPKNISTDRLLRLGTHKIIQELIDAHIQSQYLHLAGSETGRHILDSLGIRTPAHTSELVSLPRAMRAALILKLLPGNVHPEYHQSRRVARAVTPHKEYGTLEDVRWVDAACGPDGLVAVAYPAAPPLTHFLAPTCTPGGSRYSVSYGQKQCHLHT